MTMHILEPCDPDDCYISVEHGYGTLTRVEVAHGGERAIYYVLKQYDPVIRLLIAAARQMGRDEARRG